jgi:hypothetical protein
MNEWNGAKERPIASYGKQSIVGTFHGMTAIKVVRVKPFGFETFFESKIHINVMSRLLNDSMNGRSVFFRHGLVIGTKKRNLHDVKVRRIHKFYPKLKGTASFLKP